MAIVLGKYVFQCPPKYKGKNRQDYGYYTNVPQVADYWRKDLDKAYNPHHLPTCLGMVYYHPVTLYFNPTWLRETKQ